ncbi:MAG: glycine zipper 2TM domain-containing protein [Gammaproteobacteria bacterium]|nr:glycine zipper 2TM domain-containing protein [Gammaproteobacteria bacterium]
MARTHTTRFAFILAVLALGALGGTALADPQDGGWHRERAERSGQQRREADARRGEHWARNGHDERWQRDGRHGRDRSPWRQDDSHRYHTYDRAHGPTYAYGDGRGYRSDRYGHRGYQDPYSYRGYDYRYDDGYRRSRRDGNRNDDAALTIAGGVVGGLIGNHAASPENRAAGTVFGALIGGVLGHAIGQSNNDDPRHRARRGGRDDWRD